MISETSAQYPEVRPTQSLAELLAAAPEELADVDIAAGNLRCATGVPGAEDLDIRDCLATLGEWAEQVRFETERHLYRAGDPRYAEHYGHSEARLRAEFIVQVLQEDLGVRYHPDRARDLDFTDARDLFLHGLLAGGHRGTCLSMPVLYAAVGRRLGYPMKLVCTWAHIFVRWDEPDGERFNIEAAGEGVSYFDDAYYKTWPRKLTDEQVRKGRYLLSLSPAEELAMFLAARGHCLLDNGRPAEARIAYEHACRLDPRSIPYRHWPYTALAKERAAAGAGGGLFVRGADGRGPCETFVWAGGALYRNFHPTLGRFISRDPAGYVDGMSLYQYCRSAPPGGVDPTGEADVFTADGCAWYKPTRSDLLAAVLWNARVPIGFRIGTQVGKRFLVKATDYGFPVDFYATRAQVESLAEEDFYSVTHAIGYLMARYYTSLDFQYSTASWADWGRGVRDTYTILRGGRRQFCLGRLAKATSAVEAGLKVVHALNPIGDLYELASGKDAFTEEDLAWWERTLAGSGLLIKGVGAAWSVAKAGKLLDKVNDFRRMKKLTRLRVPQEMLRRRARTWTDFRRVLGEMAEEAGALARVWQMDEIARGRKIQGVLARTDYRRWLQLDDLTRARNFPLYDFQRGRRAVSLRTANTTAKAWVRGDTLRELQDHIRALGTQRMRLNGQPAQILLDLRVQPGGAAAARQLVDFGTVWDVREVVNEFP